MANTQAHQGMMRLHHTLQFLSALGYDVSKMTITDGLYIIESLEKAAKQQNLKITKPVTNPFT
jgi:hypothetical protein